MCAQVIYLDFPSGIEPRQFQDAVTVINNAPRAANMSPFELENAMLEDPGFISERQPEAVSLARPLDARLKRLAWDCQFAYRGKLRWKANKSASIVNWYKAVDAKGGDPAGAVMAADALLKLVPNQTSAYQWSANTVFYSCWEGVLYALINSNVLPWDAIAKSYGGNGQPATFDIWDDLVNFLAARRRTVQEVLLDDASYKAKTFKVGDIVMDPNTAKPLDVNSASLRSDQSGRTRYLI